MVPNQRPPRAQPEAVPADEADAEAEVEVDADSAGDVAEQHVEAMPESDDDDSTVVIMRETRDVHEHDEHDEARRAAPVVALFGDHDDDETDADSSPKASVDDLFAKLRAARADRVVERATKPDDSSAPDEGEAADAAAPVTAAEDLAVFEASPEAPVVEEALDDSPFGRRDASLTPIIIACARKLKRVLADEQNEILHALRRAEPVRSLDTMVPWQTEQAARYAAAIESELEKAALVGAASIDAGSAKEHKADIHRAGAVKPAIEALTTTLIIPLRERLERALGEADDDNGELATMVRGIYREWKTQRIDEHLDDITRTAFGRGALAAVAPGTSVCWTVDPNGPPCPDAEDNALAGTVPAGREFPTGHACAPAHEGCRCMLSLAPS
jgi:hypothetical protein